MRWQPTITSPLLISPFYQLCYNVISLAGLKIILTLSLLLSFLHNRIPHKHNVWAADNLASIYISICFFCNKPSKSKNHTSTFVYYLLFVKWKLTFTLRKGYFSQNQSSQTVSAGPELPIM